MRDLKCAELVLDFDLYPRNDVDSHHVRELCEAMDAGVDLPPVVVCRSSKRVVDGFHRVRAALRRYGPDAKVRVVEKVYKNDAELFLDAVRYNAVHGKRMDPCDRTHCLLIAERLSIPIAAVAGVLHVPADRLGELRSTRTATTAGGLVALKQTVKHFAGCRLNKRQQQANDRLSGMNQSFYANQLIELLESGMLDTRDETLMDRLRHLQELLGGVLEPVAA